MKRHELVPSHFVSLQSLGYQCENYYFGTGGRKIGITKEVLSSIGLCDDTLWAHPDIITGLDKVSNILKEEGYHLLLKDAWRPSKLYDYIINLRRERGLPVEGLISVKGKSHATGMAVDAVLVDTETQRESMMRNSVRDGLPSCFADFYRDKQDEESLAYQSLQDILLNSFTRAGFRLGGNREYWHFELEGNDKAPRF